MIKLMSFVMRFFFLSSVNFIFFRKNLLFAQARIFGNKTLTLYVVRNVPSNFNCAKNIFFVCPLDYHHRAKRRNLFTSFAFHLPSMVFTLEVQAAQTKPPKRKKKIIYSANECRCDAISTHSCNHSKTQFDTDPVGGVPLVRTL